MFEAGGAGGVPVQDQFHQFIANSSNSSAAAASRTPSNSISVPLPLPNFLHPHVSSSFDPYTFASTTAAAASSTSAQQVQHFLYQLHQLPPPPQPTTTTKIINQGKVQKNNNNSMVGMNLEINDGDQTSSADSWSSDEVLALLRIRSSMENYWFPDFTWEHVSRKLAEVGFKLRSGEKCKEKFEEESRYFINNNIHYTNNNKISNYTTVMFSHEFEDLYHQDDHDQVGLAADGENKKILESNDKPISDDNHDQEQGKIMGQNLEDDQEEEDNIINPRIDHQTGEMRSRSTRNSNNNKRKRRHKKFEMLKGFCEGVVKRLMDQQEEMHSKILQDMVRRDEEKFAREETWKKQEMDRMNQEIELRAQEQAVAGDRQARIINFLKRFTSSSSSVHDDQVLGDKNKKVPQNPNLQIESSLPSSPHDQNPSSDINVPISLNNLKIQSLSPPPPQNPSKSLPSQKLHTKSTSTTSNERLDHDIGKRWPRDEVLALINLRSSTVNNNCNNNDHQEMKELGGGNSSSNNNNKLDQIKAPLWERISQGMAELGYKRSAKRCKEKWENINKYFRKTKDINKKRSVDSRTCPYFHQLSNLYNNQASSVVDDDNTGPAPEIRSLSPPNLSDVPETNGSSPTTSTLHGVEGGKNVVVVQGPGFDYEL